MNDHEVKRLQHIHRPPASVGAAIASPHGIMTWLCDDALSEKRPEGRLLFRWHQGRQALGRWTAYDPANHLAWTWRGDDDDGESRVDFALAPSGDGTEVTVTHSELAADQIERFDRLWKDALADLKTYVEDGLNGKMLRRPMLGIMLDVVSPEMASAKGLAVDHGVLVNDVVPDHAAAKAGVEAGDVLVELGGHALSDWGSLTEALDERRAGDTVELTLWRGDQRQQLQVALSARDQPDLPTAIDDVLKLIHDTTDRMVEALEQALDGVSEQEAAYRPDEGEWTIKQVLAHLAVIERFGQDAFARTATDDTPAGWAMDAFELQQESTAHGAFDDIRTGLIADLRATQALAEHILARETAPHVVHELAGNFHWGPEHIDDHVGQIRAIRESYANR